MTTADTTDATWQAFLDTLDEDVERPEGYAAWAFGDGPEMADGLADAVLRGAKRATCSALWLYEADRLPLPREGEHSVILDGRGRAVAVIETTEVSVRRFDEVDASFAEEEGEDDRSLAAWRRAHTDFFIRALKPIGRVPTPDMPLVCQRFRRVYPVKASSLPPHEEDGGEDGAGGRDTDRSAVEPST